MAISLSNFDLFRNVEFAGVGQLIREMHQLEDERTIFRFYTGEILPRFNDHFCDPDLFLLLQRVAQKSLSFVAAFLRL